MDHRQGRCNPMAVHQLEAAARYGPTRIAPLRLSHTRSIRHQHQHSVHKASGAPASVQALRYHEPAAGTTRRARWSRIGRLPLLRSWRRSQPLKVAESQSLMVNSSPFLSSPLLSSPLISKVDNVNDPPSLVAPTNVSFVSSCAVGENPALVGAGVQAADICICTQGTVHMCTGR